MKNLGKTRPFRGPKGEVIPGSIAEVNYLLLGGLDQWVMIRGESLTNPPLIFLHGGPGFSETRLFRHFRGIDRKLGIIRETYAMLNAESQTVRGEVLELAVILLIVGEILLSLFGRR